MHSDTQTDRPTDKQKQYELFMDYYLNKEKYSLTYMVKPKYFFLFIHILITAITKKY